MSASEGPGPLEFADEDRSLGVFPKSWGMPRGSAFSAERRAWVTGHVRRAMLARKGDGKTPAERRAEVERKRYPS